jgi:DNA recombination protein RmuC
MPAEALIWVVPLALVGGVLLGVAALAWLQRRQGRAQEQAEQRLRGSFAELANAALRHNTDQFLQLASERFAREQSGVQGALREREQAFGALVEPIRQTLEKTEQQIQALERERRDAFSSLRTQIEALATGQVALQRETRNLVGALRRPEVRGRWGELTLRRVVELSGMSEHCDFTEQATAEGAQGAVRPDLLVHLPDGRELVVDAKTPLDAYLEAIEAATEEQRAAALERHAQQLDARVRELGAKAYWNQFASSPEFVVLFLPGDQFLSAALSSRPELLEYALRQSVIIATPSTLIALLKAVAYGWRQSQVTQHAEQIRALGQELHRRLASFVAHLARTGQRLGGAVESYNSAVGSLERQVLPQARRFTELGAVTGDALPTLEPLELLVRAPQSGAAESNDSP